MVVKNNEDKMNVPVSEKNLADDFERRVKRTRENERWTDRRRKGWSDRRIS